jgi:NADP-dependent 3-hydroxy acid dehydrogenase YdfG
MVSIAGQNAVITGASRGIGRAAALALAKEGVNVAVTARNEAELASLVLEASDFGVKAQAFPADASDANAVSKLRDDVLASFGHVDVLLNNAGVATYKNLVDTTVEDYDWMMNTNMRSTFLFTQAFVPSMIQRKTGCLLFVSSQAGVNGFPGEAVYCATKHAQVGFACAMDGELREHNIKVSIIAPGGVSTYFAFGTGRSPEMPTLANMSEAEDIADAIVFAAKQPPKTRVLMIGLRPMSERLYGGA